MEIRDVIHGAIPIEKWELPVLDSPYFQRLRLIKQLGFAENSFPGATHNRYIHSLGAMHTASQVFEHLFRSKQGRFILPSSTQAYQRFRAVVRLAALLHDVGHGPLSHTTEFAMPPVKKLGIKEDRKSTHEDYTLKIITDSGLTPILERAGQSFGFKPIHVAGLIDPSLDVGDDFFDERVEGERVGFRKILSQLISSELDADRMDYLRRDSFHTGVSYGQFDYDWILSNLTAHVFRGHCHLALQHRGLYAFEDFLLSRYHMFLMVYFHYKSVVYDEMLAQYFHSEDCDYELPSDIEKYVLCDDAHLFSHLKKSKNEWAKRIIERKPYRMLVELHSGVPNTRMAMQEQKRLLEKLKSDLSRKKISHLWVKTASELSKYFRKPGSTIFVSYDNLYSRVEFIPLDKCTDLFEKYRERREINRIYVDPQRYQELLGSQKTERLRYEEIEEEMGTLFSQRSG